MTNRKIVSPSDKAFSYMGRIDFSKPDSPLFIYAGRWSAQSLPHFGRYDDFSAPYI